MQAYFLDCFSGFGVGAKAGAAGLLGWEGGVGAAIGADFWFVPPGDVGDTGFSNGLNPSPALEALNDKLKAKREISNL